MTNLRRFLRHDRGTAAIEFALVGLPIIILTLGLFEFGRGLHIHNALNEVADRAQRAVLVDQTVSDAELESQIRTAFRAGPPDDLVIVHGTEVLDGQDYRRVDLSFDMRLILPTPIGSDITLFADRLILLR